MILLHTVESNRPWRANAERPALKIGTRLFVALAIPITAMIVAFAMIEDVANRTRSRDEVAREGLTIARTIQIATRNALRDQQVEDVRRLIDALSGHERIFGVRLLDASGRPIHAAATLASVPPTPLARLRALPADGRAVPERLSLAVGPAVVWRAALTAPPAPPLGFVEVFQLESFVEEDAAASSRAIAVLAVLLIAAAALTVWLVTHHIVAGPIEDLAGSARGIGEGRWSARVPVRRADELGRLAGEFNAMSERLEAMRSSLQDEQVERRRVETSLREAERLAGLGRFAAGLAHEIGTPLNVISGRAAVMLRRSEDAEQQRGLRIITSQIERISRIVRGALDFARSGDLQLVPTPLHEVVARVADLVEERFTERGLHVESLVPRDLPPLAADADRLQQVFLNLAVNAADAMSEGGCLRIGASVGARRAPGGTGPARGCVAVTFTDSGVGIPSENVPRLFEPFFTTKDVGRGTGLGLAISWGIVQEHGGWMEVESATGRGTCITVWLPLDASRADLTLEPGAAS